MRARHPLRACAFALGATLALIATACGQKSSDPGTGSGASPPSPPRRGAGQPAGTRGLELRVSEGKQGAPAYDRAKLAPAQPLAAADVQALLSRAQPLAAEPGDAQSFAFRPRSQPAPRTGTQIAGSFPPPPSSLAPPPSSTAGDKLAVVRWMPEGAVPLAPELSVTFSQPMVAVTSQADAAATTPVRLTPQPSGKWRWIGTRTIVFDPEVRFPQATTYQVEIPAGTRSATGGALAAATRFSFETPPPSVVSSYPVTGQPHPLDVPMLLVFDQKIDAAAVLAKLKLTANGRAVQLRAIDAAELARASTGTRRDKELAARIEAEKQDGRDGRWVAFRALQPLPVDAAIEIEVPAGTPSAEGPNRTKTPQRFAFRTFPPLRVVRHECGYGGICSPGMPLHIQLNNPLDPEAFDPSWVSVQPEIPGMRVMPGHDSILVQGATEARTTYTVALASGLRDDFGQTLGKRAALDWRVGDAQPTFFGPTGLVVLDPSAKRPTLDFFSTNYAQLKVKLYQVDVSDYPAFLVYLRDQWNHDKPPMPPGKKVFDGEVATQAGSNKLVETSIDLSPALPGGLGHAIAVVEPSPWVNAYQPPRMISWVQSTRIGIDAYVDADQLIGFATDLATGAPASGVALELRPFGTQATTDASGLATIALSPTGPTGPQLLVARRGQDVAFVSEREAYWAAQGTWIKQSRPATLAWYVVDDRKTYKPAEQVSLKGWVRAIEQVRNGDIAGSGGASSLSFVVRDARGNQIATGAAKIDAVGGFDAQFALPKTPNLGTASIIFDATGEIGGRHVHTFEIQEFRRPEFEVTAQASQGPFLVGGSGDVTVAAKYYAGGPLPGADVRWLVQAQPTTFTPPNRDGYVFGEWQPWWGYRARGGFHGGRPQGGKVWELAGKTDATGAHPLHLDFLSIEPAAPMSVVATASVTDVNRQTWSASATSIVHPSSLYVGLQMKRPFVEKGVPFELGVIGVDLEGKPVPGAKVEVVAARVDWEYKAGEYVQKEVDPQTCTPALARDAVPCTFATRIGGMYQVTATIVDAEGRPNQTRLSFWVSGGEQPAARAVQQEVVQIIPDKKEYAAGNTAELLIQAPFYPAEGVVSWRRSGIVKTERIQLTGPTRVITVPISDAMVPNVYVQVDLVGAAPRTDDKGKPDPKLPKRPAYATGTINLPVPPKARTLAVEVAASAAKVAPGERTQIAVEVKDARGAAVPDAEVAVIVVDEAILSLAAYQFPSPIDVFYAERHPDARDHYLRSYVKLARPEPGMLDGNAPTGGGGIGGDARFGAPASAAPPVNAAVEVAMDGPMMLRERTKGEEGQLEQKPAAANAAIAIRSNFNPLAAFAPAVKTDASGRATVEVKVPDNLTRYRIVAIATAGDKQFGKGENALTARLPLMVRPSPPRFLNFGDVFQLPVVVQNQTDAPMTVKLAVRTTNAALTDGAGRSVTVPANDRVEVQFPAAAELAGTARFQIVGAAGAASDAAEVALPVWTPATTEAFATYGVIDDGVVKQPVALPGAVVPQFGGLEVTTASTNLQALTDAMIYLVKYPYECAEQRASRVLAIAALQDVLAAFKAKDLPSPAAMQVSITTDVERLSQMQNTDGGFAFWDRGHPSIPFVSVYVTSALVHAKQKGFVVPADLIDRARPYLRDIERFYPGFYPPEVRHAISAYALYVRKQLGDLDVAKAKQLIAQAGGVDHLTIEANGWLLGVLTGQASAEAERKAIVRHALNKVSETAGAANFTTSYGDGAYTLLASDRRADAVMLDALIQEQKDLDLIPKLVTGLLAHRKAGRWLNTQENTFALLAMDRYFETYEKATPDFVARVWLGNDYAGEHAFRGRTTDDFAIAIPMKEVAARDKQDLTIQKDGKGRLYYRIGMTYAPASLQLSPADHGFVVQRTYEGVDDPGDVVRQADGTWKIKAGARVRVKLTMVNENRRYHVALVDPIPAGLEPMNPALAVTGPVPTDPAEQKQRGAYWWWYGPWYEHQNLRDERVEAFASLLWEGVHAYTYVARATTPGRFVVPPPKAEEMYMPETFGRGASDRVIVE